MEFLPCLPGTFALRVSHSLQHTTLRTLLDSLGFAGSRFTALNVCAGLIVVRHLQSLPRFWAGWEGFRSCVGLPFPSLYPWLDILQYLARVIHAIRFEAQGSPSRCEEGVLRPRTQANALSIRRSKPDEVDARVCKPQKSVRKSVGLGGCVCKAEGRRGVKFIVVVGGVGDVDGVWMTRLRSHLGCRGFGPLRQ